MPTTLISTTSSRLFAVRLADRLNKPLLEIDRRSFPDGETYLRIPLEDRYGLVGHAVVIIGATDSPTSLEDLYRLGCAAAKYGASQIILVIPYFGYSTMERAVKPGEVVTAKTICRQLSAIPRANRGNWILLMDLHASGIVHYFEEDTVALELYAEPVVVNAIRRLNLESPCLASTDMGRAKWVERFANVLDAPVALIHKKRHSGSRTEVSAVVGDVNGKDVVIFDDMIRTGSSLVQAANAYIKGGARSVNAVATHLILPPGALEIIESSPIARVIGTDTHPNHQIAAIHSRFEIVSVAEVFAEAVAKLTS